MHKKNLTWIAAIAFFIGAIMLSAPSAKAAASGTVSIDIDYPPLVILYYFDTFNVDVPAAALAGLMVGGTGDTADATPGTASPILGSTFDPDLNITVPNLSADPAQTYLYLRRSWAVRSVGASGGTQKTRVSVAFAAAPDSDKLDLSATEFIMMDAIGVRMWGGTGTGSAFVEFDPTGLTNYEAGDVVIELDLTDATLEGSYTGGSYVITAENL